MHIDLSNNAITKHKDTHIAHWQSLQRTDAKNENTTAQKGSTAGETPRVIRMMKNRTHLHAAVCRMVLK
jgi:hypothetical protein